MKLILFDFDGVLASCKEIHYQCLNKAIASVAGEKYVISHEEHLSTFDGKKTKDKLEILTKNKGLPRKFHHDIWSRKQDLTNKDFANLAVDHEKQNLLLNLKKLGFSLACCSNCIRDTLNTALSRLGLLDLFDLVLSNEDVTFGKPHPEIYWRAMTQIGALPENTLIIEDSPNGLLAAHRSGAKVMRVNNPYTYTTIDILKYFNMTTNKPKWKDDKLNILIPAAGHGARFAQAGYSFPKPLIEVMGKPMIQMVVENINVDANYIYVVQKEHAEKYNLKSCLDLITPNCKMILVDKVTEGAACTTLLAKEFINNDNPLFMINCDQWIDWDSSDFFYKMNETGCDGAILNFGPTTHPKWSFSKIENGFIIQVAEKEVISNIGNVGGYYWARGSDYVYYAEQMINKNIRVKNEFYVAPVYNEAILDKKIILPYMVKEMLGVGTPEDLNFFLQRKQYDYTR